jgi:hypothetical protein
MMVGIDPFAYLRDVLHRLPDAPPSMVGQLMPRAWPAQLSETTHITYATTQAASRSVRGGLTVGMWRMSCIRKSPAIFFKINNL